MTRATFVWTLIVLLIAEGTAVVLAVDMLKCGMWVCQ